MSTTNFIVVTRQNASAAVSSHDDKTNMDIVRELHGGILTETFEDLEELELWEKLLRTAAPDDAVAPAGEKKVEGETATPNEEQSSAPTVGGILFFVVVAVDSASGAVVGGASCELYTAFGIMTYLAVKEQYRRRGITTQITLLANETFRNLAAAERAVPLQYSCILVVHASDESADEQHNFDPKLRQRIWSKLGFWPVDTGLVMPGRLGRLCSQRHQLCIFRPCDVEAAPGVAQLLVAAPPRDDDAKEWGPSLSKGFSLPLDVVVTFVEELFSCILRDEGNFSDQNGEIEHCIAELKRVHGNQIRVSPTLWH